MFLRNLALAGAASLAAGGAWAGSHGCANDMPVKSLTNAFPAYVIMTDEDAQSIYERVREDMDAAGVLSPDTSAVREGS